MTFRRNLYIEALANHRDNLQMKFSISRKNIIPLFMIVVAFPVFVYQGGKYAEVRQQQQLQQQQQ